MITTIPFVRKIWKDSLENNCCDQYQFVLFLVATMSHYVYALLRSFFGISGVSSVTTSGVTT